MLHKTVDTGCYLLETSEIINHIGKVFTYCQESIIVVQSPCTNMVLIRYISHKISYIMLCYYLLTCPVMLVNLSSSTENILRQDKTGGEEEKTGKSEL